MTDRVWRDPTWIAGKYECLEAIGEGGMATVYRGVTHGAGGFTRKVAIKKVLPKHEAKADFVAMFVEEARVVSELHHPNIVQIHDFDRDQGGAFFLVMEWIDGVDVWRWLRSFARVDQNTPWPLVAAIGIEVLRALSFAHSRKDAGGQPAPVIHRDVSPQNILLSIDGGVKLADFGLARARDRTSMTTPGTIKGKLAYLAPEVMHGEVAGPKSDLYGMGIVLWEALTGERLFLGDTDVATVIKVRKGEVPPIREVRPDVPALMAEVVHGALARDPKERFESAQEMHRALAAILRTHPEPTDAEPLGASVREAVSRLPKRLAGRLPTKK